MKTARLCSGVLKSRLYPTQMPATGRGFLVRHLASMKPRPNRFGSGKDEIPQFGDRPSCTIRVLATNIPAPGQCSEKGCAIGDLFEAANQRCGLGEEVDAVLKRDYADRQVRHQRHMVAFVDHIRQSNHGNPAIDAWKRLEVGENEAVVRRVTEHTCQNRPQRTENDAEIRFGLESGGFCG